MRFNLKRYCHPKYWLLTLLLMLFRAISYLPDSIQVVLGKWLGALFVKISKIRSVTRQNISACFPELESEALDAAVLESCRELGLSIIETFYVWFRYSSYIFERSLSVEGKEHFDAALAEGRGIIVLSCHYGSVDINGAILSQFDRQGRSLFGTYRDTDAVINAFLHGRRGQFIDKMLPAGDQRGVLKALRKGALVWYAPDIEVKNNASAFVDFMGVQASTTTAIARLAKAGNAIVLPFVHYREGDAFEYTAKFLPPLNAIPSGDVVADTRAVNEAIERMIQPEPLRYWWAIKRFKNRPEGSPSIY